MTTEQQVQLLTDKEEIRSLRIQFANCMDTQDWQSFPLLFTPDVEVDYSAWGNPTTTMKKEAFVSMIQKTLSRPGIRTSHYISNQQVFLEGNHAHSKAYVLARHYLKINETEHIFDMTGYYTERQVRTADGWKVAAVQLTPVFMEGDAASLLMF